MKNLATILAIGLIGVLTFTGCATYDGTAYRVDREPSLKKGEYYGRDGKIHIIDGSSSKYSW